MTSPISHSFIDIQSIKTSLNYLCDSTKVKDSKKQFQKTLQTETSSKALKTIKTFIESNKNNLDLNSLKELSASLITIQKLEQDSWSKNDSVLEKTSNMFKLLYRRFNPVKITNTYNKLNHLIGFVEAQIKELEFSNALKEVELNSAKNYLGNALTQYSRMEETLSKQATLPEYKETKNPFFLSNFVDPSLASLFVSPEFEKIAQKVQAEIDALSSDKPSVQALSPSEKKLLIITQALEDIKKLYHETHPPLKKEESQLLKLLLLKLNAKDLVTLKVCRQNAEIEVPGKGKYNFALLNTQFNTALTEIIERQRFSETRVAMTQSNLKEDGVTKDAYNQGKQKFVTYIQHFKRAAGPLKDDSITPIPDRAVVVVQENKAYLENARKEFFSLTDELQKIHYFNNIIREMAIKSKSLEDSASNEPAPSFVRNAIQGVLHLFTTKKASSIPEQNKVVDIGNEDIVPILIALIPLWDIPLEFLEAEKTFNDKSQFYDTFFTKISSAMTYIATWK